MNNIQQYKNKILKCKGKFESLVERKNDIDDNLSELIIRQKSLEEAQVFIQMVAHETQSQLRYRLVDIVNLAIETCFEDVVFDIIFDIKRGSTEARLVFMKNGIEMDPISTSGGGIIDLVSFALRIALWNIGHSDNVIIFDEPLKWLQPKELQIEAFRVMKELSEKMSIQFILVANSVGSENILEIADRIFEVKQKDENGYKVSKVAVRGSKCK
jgi:DNA repair exonuclease SbcCD ATPase subunit